MARAMYFAVCCSLLWGSSLACSFSAAFTECSSISVNSRSSQRRSLHQVLATTSTFILTVLFASTVVTALSTQYFSDDLSLLVSSPISLPALYGSRLVLTALQASWMVVLFSIPIYAAFALTSPAPRSFSVRQFLGAAALALAPLVVIATTVGSMVTSVLMAVFPARRVREMLVLLAALFVVFLVFLIRVQQPEKLLNPRSIYDISEFFAAFQTPSSSLLPSSWATSLLIAGRRAEPLPGMPLALLWSTAAATIVLGSWLARAVYYLGYSRAQESRPAKFSSLPIVDRFLAAVTLPFEVRFRSLLLKDMRTFARDATQWSQLLLLLALVVVYLYNFSVLPSNFTFATFFLQNLFSFLNLASPASSSPRSRSVSCSRRYRRKGSPSGSFAHRRSRWISSCGASSGQRFRRSSCCPKFLPSPPTIFSVPRRS